MRQNSRMSDRENLTDFFTKILDGIGYGKLPKTSRVSSWMKNNNALEGPCLNFLKENITEQNLVTIGEMNMFTELQKQGNLPSEVEIDAELAEYLGEPAIDLQHFHLSALQNESSQASKYYEALRLEEQILRRQCGKLREEIGAFESRKNIDSDVKDTIKTSMAKTNAVHNKVSGEIECELSKITQAFSLLVHDSNAIEDLNLFRMNFDTFRKINKTFREAVNGAIRKQFNNTEKPDTSEQCSSEVAQEDTAMSIVQSLGRYNYQRLKWRCEETELIELSDYVEKVLKNFNFESVDAARLKSLTDANFESTYQVQMKISPLTAVLEKFHSDFVVKKMLLSHRKRLMRLLKADYEFLKKISHLCTSFVDLMTLQVCLSHNEKENVAMIVATCALARQKLDEHARKHRISISKLEKVIPAREPSRTSLDVTNLESSNSLIGDSENDDPVNVMRNKILSFVGDCLGNYFAVRQQLEELDRVMFSGPVRQLFFSNDLRNDELLIKQQYNHFSEQYKEWKAQYYNATEKTNVTELDQFQKSFALMFLTSSSDLRNNLEQLRNSVLQNRSKLSATSTGAQLGASSFHRPDLKRGNASSII